MGPRSRSNQSRGQIRQTSSRPARAVVKRCLILVVIAAAHVLTAGYSRGAEPAAPRLTPADEVLRLVPPDSAVILSVENLRDHARAFLESKLAQELRKVPVVRSWFGSEKYLQFERSSRQIEDHLRTTIAEVRDELLGDAAVLALQIPREADADADAGRGLLIAKVRDLALLERLVSLVNTSQQESGELAAVVDRKHHGTTYSVREFPPAANRPAECFVIFPDGTFAFSNSESLIQSVVDRKARMVMKAAGTDAGAQTEPGLGELPRFMAVRNKLPERAVARLFVDPRHIERMLAGQPRPDKPTDARMMALIERDVAAHDYFGASLVSSDDSITLHTVETLNPSALDPWLRHWAADPRRVDAGLFRLPATALGAGVGYLDATALFGALAQIMADLDQPKIANLEKLLSGLLLGLDVREQVLPQVGPGILVYLDSPSDATGSANRDSIKGTARAASAAWPFPVVVVVGLGGAPELASQPSIEAAVETGLRTVLAMTALDDKRAQGRSRITARPVGGLQVMTLDPPVPFAYAVDRGRHCLVAGTSPESVARYIETASDPKASERFRALCHPPFTGKGTCAALDVAALDRLADQHRASLVKSLAARQNRPADEVDHDLTNLLSLARLFRVAFFTSQFEADATIIHRSLGLIGRGASVPGAPSPGR